MKSLCKIFTNSSLFSLAVSAFYAECADKLMEFNAHIWTKSKFLGLSIGVEMVGQGKLLIKKEYTSFPVSNIPAFFLSKGLQREVKHREFKDYGINMFIEENTA